jgi:16S rRNA (guanine966-N2)-methyltransferase
MRIVGGKFAGRELTSPGESRVRPTAERVRVGLLTMLKSDLEKARILDLFAGTGALGLEALSRGARYVDFVENGPASLHALKANFAALRVREKTRIFKKDALPFVAALEADRYDITFVDPPYNSRMLDRVIDTWKERRFSRILACEHATEHELPRGFDKRIFDDSAVTIYRLDA